MAEALLYGQSGGGLKLDQIASWRKFNIENEISETTTTLTSEETIFGAGPGAQGSAYYIGDDITITIDYTSVLYLPTHTEVGVSSTATKRAYGLQGGLNLRNKYYTVTDVSQWIPFTDVGYGTKAPAGAMKTELVSSSVRGSFIEIVYAKEGAYPEDGIQDDYWYEKIDTIEEPISNLAGTLSFSGTYASSTYYNESGCRMGCNNNNEVFLIIQGGTSTAYENVIFTLSTAPEGIALAQTPSYTHASNPVGVHYGCVLTGVTKKIDIAVNFDNINSSYDYVRANLTVTYA